MSLGGDLMTAQQLSDYQQQMQQQAALMHHQVRRIRAYARLTKLASGAVSSLGAMFAAAGAAAA